MSGNGRQPPESIEYVVVPVPVDEGEMETAIGVVDVSMLDLDQGLTVIGVPEGTPPEVVQEMARAVQSSVQERGIHRQFMFVSGHLQQKWRFVKLVRRDKWDPVFAEERKT